MMRSLMAALQTKIHQIFLDSELNSNLTVEENLSDSFGYIARRFHAYVTELPQGKRRYFWNIRHLFIIHEC